MSRPRTTIILAGIALSWISVSGCAAPSDKEAVERRFDGYMNAWIDRDFDRVWDAMSPKLKRGNDNSKAKYRKFAEDQNIYFVRYTRLGSEINADRAQVTADVVISDAAKTDTVEERQVCDLVRHQGSWYVDDCKSLNPPT